MNALSLRLTHLWWRWRGRMPQTWRIELPRIEEMYYNEVLPGRDAIADAVSALGWEHPTPEKTWDFLKAIHLIAAHRLPQSAAILDAGCVGSPILEWLYGQGYRRLYGVDLSDHGLPTVPGLTFRKADLTNTPFPDLTFDAITCLSVIEHGVDVERFLTECARLLVPGGLLLLSCDYHEPGIETADVPRDRTFDLPWTILDRAAVERLVERAVGQGLDLVQPVRWHMGETPVTWNGKNYTFLFLAFKKKEAA